MDVVLQLTPTYTLAAPGVQINDRYLAGIFTFGVPLVGHRCDAVGGMPRLSTGS